MLVSKRTFKGLFTGMWSNILDIRSPIVKIFFKPAINSEKSCGRSFFFYTSKRLLPKKPKNEVLVAAEPGKCPQNEYQKADVGQNWSQTDFAVVSVN